MFNLIPLAPLDGSKVLRGLLPPGLATRYARIERYGPLILMSVVIFDFVSNQGILGRSIGPVVSALISAATGY